MPNLLLKHKIRIPIGIAGPHPIGIIRKVDGPILHPLMLLSLIIQLIEHLGLPPSTSRQVTAPRSLQSLELVSVVGVLQIELHVLGDVDVDDDWAVAFDVLAEEFELG